MRRVGLILAFAASAAVAGVWGWQAYASLTMEAATQSRVRVEIPEGHSFERILDKLQEAGVRFSRNYVRIYATLKGVSRNLQAGVYDIPAQATMAHILERLHKGEIVRLKLTIVEGWSLRRILAAMKEHPYIRMESEDPDELAGRLGVEDSLEGWVHPKTYSFKEGTSNIAVLRMGYNQTRSVLSSLWERRPLDFPLKTPYEALILASMIEKEAHVQEERPRIAGVFLRRLKRGMRLQSDPTVIYGLGDDFSGRLRRSDLRRETPYNTYVHKGLPPTPIATPSENALRAVFQATEDKALYFVAKGDGSHYFSDTYKEHLRAVNKYLRSKE